MTKKTTFALANFGYTLEAEWLTQWCDAEEATGQQPIDVLDKMKQIVEIKLSILNAHLNTHLAMVDTLFNVLDYGRQSEAVTVEFDDADKNAVIHYIRENGLVGKLDKRLHDVTTLRMGYVPLYSYTSILANDHLLMRVMLEMLVDELFTTDGLFYEYEDKVGQLIS